MWKKGEIKHDPKGVLLKQEGATYLRWKSWRTTGEGDYEALHWRHIKCKISSRKLNDIYGSGHYFVLEVETWKSLAFRWYLQPWWAHSGWVCRHRRHKRPRIRERKRRNQPRRWRKRGQWSRKETRILKLWAKRGEQCKQAVVGSGVTPTGKMRRGVHWTGQHGGFWWPWEWWR